MEISDIFKQFEAMEIIIEIRTTTNKFQANK